MLDLDDVTAADLVSGPDGRAREFADLYLLREEGKYQTVTLADGRVVAHSSLRLAAENEGLVSHVCLCRLSYGPPPLDFAPEPEPESADEISYEDLRTSRAYADRLYRKPARSWWKRLADRLWRAIG